MIDFVLNKLSPESIGIVLVLGIIVSIFSLKMPSICFAFGFPALLFLGQLKLLFPISVSATAAAFPLFSAISTIINKKSLSFNICQKVFILITIYMTFSLGYTASPTYGTQKTVLFIFMVLPLILFAPNILSNIKRFETSLSIINFSLLVYIFSSLILSILNKTTTVRWAALSDVIFAGQLFGLSIVVFLVQIFNKKGKFTHKLFYFLMIIISSILLLKSGTRGALLGLCLTGIFYIWFLFPKFLEARKKNQSLFHQKLVIYSLLILAIFYSFIIIAPGNTFERMFTIKGLFSNFTQYEMKYWESSRGRTLNFNVAIEAFFSNPIGGVGIGGFKNTIQPYLSRYSRNLDESAPAYPHNVILEFASELGSIGLILILFVFFKIGKIIYVARQNFVKYSNIEYNSAFCSLVFMYGLCVSMTSLDLPKMMILWWGIALLLTFNKVHFENFSE